MPLASWFISVGRWLDGSVARIVRWVAFFGLVAAVMSWIASHIAPIYAFGWGGVAFAGVGAACVVTLVVSVAIMAYRYLNPHCQAVL